MNGRDGYPAGVPCWVDTEQPDPAASVGFYGPLFGWEFEERTPPGSDDRYFVARLDGQLVAAVGSATDGRADAPVWNTYVWVDDADAVTAAATAAGGTVLLHPHDVGPAGRMAVLADPAGVPIRLWQAGTNRGAEVVNADNSWNWSNLDTPDPAGAAAFYGAVFGWELTTVDLGQGVAMMWRRPGYGDHLAEREPGLRERQASAGAPPGFADAIGWLSESADGDPAGWSVTFAVGDTDGVVARAVELGGTVVVDAHDESVVRIAVLADPAGAVFTVSHFDPG